MSRPITDRAVVEPVRDLREHGWIVARGPRLRRAPASSQRSSCTIASTSSALPANGGMKPFVRCSFAMLSRSWSIGPRARQLDERVAAAHRVAGVAQRALDERAAHELRGRIARLVAQRIRIVGRDADLARRRGDLGRRIDVEYSTPRTVYGLRAPSRTNSPAAVAPNASASSSVAVAPLMYRRLTIRPTIAYAADQQRRAGRDADEHRHRHAAAEHPRPTVRGDHVDVPDREYRHHRHRQPRTAPRARISARLRSSRDRSIVLITMHAASDASAIATTVRNSSDGKKLGLKKPSHTPPSGRCPA